MTIIVNGSNTPTAGAVGYGDGSNLAFTAAGTSGQVLTSAGTGTPTWSTPSAGAMTLISTQTASSSTSLEWTGLSGYDKYLLIFKAMKPVAPNDTLQWYVANGSGYITSGYYVIGFNSYNGSLSGISQTYPSYGGITHGVANTGMGASGSAYLIGMLGGVNLVSPFTSIYPYSSVYENEVASNFLVDTTAKTSFKIFYSSGNIASGTASLYGITS